jgi:hypothetical protein
VTPVCATPSTLGSARLSPDTLEDVNGDPLCLPDRYYVVFDGADALTDSPIPCTTSAELGPLDPGLHDQLQVRVQDAGGVPLGSQDCTATVQPGTTVDINCP